MSLRPDTRGRPGLAREEGLTVVEVMVAALIVVVGALGVATLVGAAAHNSFRSEQSQVLSDRLQQEMERIKDLPYNQIALTALPTDTSDLKDPRWRTVGTSFATGRDGSNPEPLVYNGAGLYAGDQVEEGMLDPTPTPFQNGDVSGTIYRFVAFEDDPTCLASLCPGAQDIKRVIVAVRLDSTSAGGTRRYQELHAQLTDPEATPVDNSCEGPGCETEDDDTKPWTFWLTDTPCNFDDRQPIVSDHATHNTRGICDAGGEFGVNEPGAPDLMVTHAPPFNEEQPLYDFATDIEPSQNPGLDKGVQLKSLPTAGCSDTALEIRTNPDSGDPFTFQKIHKWLSNPIPTGSDVLLDGTATLDLWTQTVNEQVYPASICVWLFIRRTNLLGVSFDSAITNQGPPLAGASHYVYSQAQWPTSWREAPVPLQFASDVHLIEGDRLGVAVAVERQGTGDGSGTQGLQFLYDEPSFDSRLEIKTHSVLPF
jgi:hypothetical protein